MKKTTVTIIILFALLFTSILLYLTLKPLKTSSLPSSSPEWKIYTDEKQGFSFKYPENNYTVCPEKELFSLFSKEEVKDTDACTGIIYETPYISFGKYFGDLSKETPISQSETIIDDVPISIKTFVKGNISGDTVIKVATITLKTGILEFNAYGPLTDYKSSNDLFYQILSTFKIDQAKDGQGIVKGKISYPSEGTAPGVFTFKNISTGEIITQEYQGLNLSNEFSFKIKPGTYHLSFKINSEKFIGYYDQCGLTGNGCNSDETHRLLDLVVISNKVTNNVVISDFFYSPEQEKQLKETF